MSVHLENKQINLVIPTEKERGRVGEGRKERERERERERKGREKKKGCHAFNYSGWRGQRIFQHPIRMVKVPFLLFRTNCFAVS